LEATVKHILIQIVMMFLDTVRDKE
jgi:hypothetical protein